MRNKGELPRMQVAEKVFMLAHWFTCNSFKKKEAWDLFTEYGVRYGREALTPLVESGYLQVHSKTRGQKRAENRYFITKRGFEVAIEYRKMMERSQRLLSHKEGKQDEK